MRLAASRFNETAQPNGHPSCADGIPDVAAWVDYWIGATYQSISQRAQRLMIGFGALLILICVASVDALAVLRQVRTSETRIRDAYLKRDSLMEEIRSYIYQSSTVERDICWLPPRRGRARKSNVGARSGQKATAPFKLIRPSRTMTIYGCSTR